MPVFFRVWDKHSLPYISCNKFNIHVAPFSNLTRNYTLTCCLLWTLNTFMTQRRCTLLFKRELWAFVVNGFFLATPCTSFSVPFYEGVLCTMESYFIQLTKSSEVHIISAQKHWYIPSLLVQSCSNIYNKILDLKQTILYMNFIFF